MEPQSKVYQWQVPNPSSITQLKILNSFTRQKELFVPNENRTIKWYSCGPTVYDVSHLGHARCYITFDIIRRILADYFGFQVFYVMNITDIDDKIVKRARSNYLCDKFIDTVIQSQGSRENLLTQLKQMLDNYKSELQRLSGEVEQAKLEMMENTIKISSEALDALNSLATTNSLNQVSLKENLEKMRDIIAEDQDAKLRHTVTDHKIFKALTLKYEQEYHDDMQNLGVLPPCALTRVSEYIDEIGLYIKKLEANGFAYRADGSVWFDTNKFDSDPKHSYAKLVRSAFGNKKSLDEGEGELTVGQQKFNKRSPNDFALWKKSNPGEPSWSAQDYEDGRPGWHIECSVMASQLLGENFDIHSGGCDLKFPHHDNEIAQAEAYYNTGKNWVNYFVHSGHLSIAGLKMSKSLKNFVTIRQALQDYSARQLRFAFLAHGWADTLDYSENTMNTAASYEQTFKEFLFNVANNNRHFSKSSTAKEGLFRKWSLGDAQLNQKFIETVNKVDKALCDSFNTRSALDALTALIKECNKAGMHRTDLVLTNNIANYISKILSIFGASFSEIELECPFQRSSPGISAGEVASGEKQASVDALVDAFAQFRYDVRRISKLGVNQQSVEGRHLEDILKLCDKLRDSKLPDVGWLLDDKEVDGNPYNLRFDPDGARAFLNAKERAQAEKELANLEKLKLQQQREEKMKLPPTEMFRSQLDKYSKFDDKGMPTHDSAGKEISKSSLKKLQRLYAEQEARYNKYIGLAR